MTPPFQRPVLDRRAAFDDRSRDHGIRPLLGTQVLRGTTLHQIPYPLPLDQGAEGACFPEGTWVRMADGSQIQIQDIRRGDQVVTAGGNTRHVTDTMCRATDELFAVRLRGHSWVVSTPEHPYLTEQGYVAAKDLTSEHRVAVTRYLPESTQRLNGYKMTPELGRLIGLYAAEGCISRARRNDSSMQVRWSLHENERSTLAQEIADLAKQVFDRDTAIGVRKNSQAISVRLYDTKLAALFSVWVPGSSKHGDKHLSAGVTSGPREFLRAVLQGWIDGDGHVRRSTVQGVTVSEHLALDMHAIANGLGLSPRFNQSNPAMNSHAATRQLRYDVSWATGEGLNKQPMTDSAVWRKVTDTHRWVESCLVYNLHVEGDESYVANGLGVHNCVGFGWTGQMAVGPIFNRGSNTYAQAYYMAARRIDRREGRNWPEGASVLAGAKVAKSRGLISGYKWAFGIEDVIDTLCAKGPVVLGINWYESMYETDFVGKVQVNGALVGGHCILATGYIQNHPEFGGDWIQWLNSWGPHYGVRGVGFIRVRDLDMLLKQGGEAVIANEVSPRIQAPHVPWYQRVWDRLFNV